MIACIIVFFVFILLTALMVPFYIHAAKLDYLIEQGYIKVDRFEIDKRLIITYRKGDKTITEDDLKKLSLQQIRENY